MLGLCILKQRFWKPFRCELRVNRLLFRFTIIWEKIIVIIGEKWTKVLGIIWERVELRVA